MTFVVALIGRPNVGKSTLFNCLTRTNDALVADEPGLTRDRQYGLANTENGSFIVIDTGGIGEIDGDVNELMLQQSLKAADEANHIFFLVDAKAGVESMDLDIANKLRENHKSVTVVVNKVDGLGEDLAKSDFYQFGFKEVIAISASHNRGIASLLEATIVDKLETLDSDVENKPKGICVALIGRPNVGKSTLVNRMLGEERVVAFDMPGTTRDSIYIPFEKDGDNYTLVDTAGIRKRSRTKEKHETFSVIKALKAITLSNVCMVLFDAKEGIVEQDLHIVRFAVEAGRALVILVNKWDGLSEDEKERIKSDFERRLGFASFAPSFYISAKHGSGVGLLFGAIQKVYKSANRDLKTADLTKVLESAVAKHPAPMVGGRRIKLKYAHMGGKNPPLIIIHGNQVKNLSKQYQRYLVNEFRKAFSLSGTPIKLQLRSSDNPYKDKKNKLTASQLRKRKRMIKHHKDKKK